MKQLVITLAFQMHLKIFLQYNSSRISWTLSGQLKTSLVESITFRLTGLAVLLM